MLYYIFIVLIIIILFIPSNKKCYDSFENKDINLKNVSNNILSYSGDVAKYLLIK